MRVNNQLTLETIQKALREKKPYMEQQYKIKEIGVFGSYVHGSQTQRSDIDILVDFHSTISAFDYVRLKFELSDLFGRKVDLVAKQALKPNIGTRILGEVKYV